MSLKYTSVVIQDIWNSEVVQFLDCLLTDYWSTVGITSEIEARLGKITEGGFVSGVSQKFFYAMRDYLKSRNYWTDDNAHRLSPRWMMSTLWCSIRVFEWLLSVRAERTR